MSKQILLGFDAIKKLETGVNKLSNAVKVNNEKIEDENLIINESLFNDNYFILR